MLQIDKLWEISNERYPFHFSAYFGHGLLLFGREAGQFIGYTLIHLLFFIAVRTLSKEASLYCLLVLPFFLSGYYVVARDIDRDEEIPFRRFFTGYYHAPTMLVLGGIILIVCGVLSLPFFMLDPIRHLALMGYPQFLTTLYLTFGVYPLLLPVVFCYSFLRWAPMLFLFSRMSILEALVMSCRLVARRWFLHFAFTLVLAIIGVYFSTYFFFILSLFLVGVVACVDYASFAQITGLNHDESDTELPDQVGVIVKNESPAPLISAKTTESTPTKSKRIIQALHTDEDADQEWHVPDEKELSEKMERLFKPGRHFEFKNYIRPAFRLFSNDIGNFLPYTFIVILIFLLIRMAGPLGTVVNMLLANQLIAGYFVAGAALERGQKRGISTYFAAFEFIQPIGFFSLVQFLVNILLFLPFLLLVGYNMFRPDLFGSSAFPYWSLLLLLPVIYVNIAWRWAPALMIFYHMDLWPAMETSRKLITRNLFVHVVHLLMLGFPFLVPVILNATIPDVYIRLAGVLGLLLLGYSFGADYCAFADVVDLWEDQEDTMDLTDHLIEGRE